MALGGGTLSGPRLAAWDLQNNNADWDVKLVIRVLGISGLLGFNSCPLCFIAVSMHYVTRVLAALGICAGASFLGISHSLSSRLKTLRSARAARMAAPVFPILGIGRAAFPSPRPLSLLTAGRWYRGWFSSSLPASTSLFYSAQPASLPPSHSLLFCPVGCKSLGKICLEKEPTFIQAACQTHESQEI